MTQTDALARAIAYLDAVEVAKPGDHTSDGGLVMVRLYAWKGRDNAWTIGSALDLADFGAYLIEEPGDTRGYCGSVVVKAPWWSPEQRFAAKTVGGEYFAYGTSADIVHAIVEKTDAPDVWQVYTVNYETGEEVSA